MIKLSTIKKNKFLIISIIFSLTVWLWILKFEKNQTEQKNNNKETITSNNGYYEVKEESYGFSKYESDLNNLIKASRTNDIEKIKKLLMLGNIKTFPKGKKVILVKQGISTIKIKDPDTGIEYYGVTESIK